MTKLERIHVCYAVSDRTGTYTKILGTAVCSVLMNTEAPITVHILHDDTLTYMNRECFKDMVESKFGQKICFHDVGDIYGNIWEHINELIPNLASSRLSIATFFRLLLGEVLSNEKRVIYLDADTIVNMEIKELWDMEMGENTVLAAPDPIIQATTHNTIEKGLVEQSEYFNAGVLLIDLEKFRNIENLLEKSLCFLSDNNPIYLDQDVLNYFFPKSCLLPSDYNCFVWMERNDNEPIKKYIYHYVNNCLGMNMNDAHNALFFKYFSKTPWCNENFIGNLANLISSVKFEMFGLANLCAGKRRVAIAMGGTRKVVYDMLDLRDDEEYISIEDIGNYKLDFNKNKDIFMILLSDNDYAGIRDILSSYGLKEDVHFVNLAGKLGLLSNNAMNDYMLFLQC